MQQDIRWKSEYYHTSEHCQLSRLADRLEIQSHITGRYENTAVDLRYTIHTDLQWQVRSFTVNSRLDDMTTIITGAKTRTGTWLINGLPDPALDTCIDIDISLTPFTNSLPINRLSFIPDQPQQIHVVYMDILTKQILHRQQQYTCLSPTRYHFANIPNDFEADITTDENGLVTDYPGLFTRIK